jgi:proliferating cell nuclear antigen
MFKAVTKDPRLLRDCIDTASQLIDEGVFNIKEDGIELLAADRAMVSVIDMKLKSTSFEEYVCDRKSKIGLNLLNFLTILKRANPGDELTISLKEKENKLEIIFTGVSKRKFSIPLLEISSEEIPQVEQLKFAASAEVKSDVIIQGINDADVIADSVIIELSENEFRMFAEGDGSRTELKLENGDKALKSLNAKETVRSRYSIEYLKKMLKAAKIAEIAKISLGNDYPIKLEFKNKDISISMVLAPRVSEG